MSSMQDTSGDEDAADLPDPHSVLLETIVAVTRTMSARNRRRLRRRLEGVWREQDGRETPEQAVAAYVATLAPGSRVLATEFRDGWAAWAGERADLAGMGLVALGRLAGRCPRLRKGRGVGGRRVWTVLARGCVGAPGCPNPMLKMSDRCAEHQEPAEG